MADVSEEAVFFWLVDPIEDNSSKYVKVFQSYLFEGDGSSFSVQISATCWSSAGIAVQ